MRHRNILRAVLWGVLLAAPAACVGDPAAPGGLIAPPPLPPAVPPEVVDLGIITNALVAEDSLRPADPGCVYPWDFDIGLEPCRTYRVSAPSAGTITASLSWSPAAWMSLLDWRVASLPTQGVPPFRTAHRVAVGESLTISVGLHDPLGNPAARVYQLTLSFTAGN